MLLLHTDLKVISTRDYVQVTKTPISQSGFLYLEVRWNTDADPVGYNINYASVAELADAQGLEPCAP